MGFGPALAVAAVANVLAGAFPLGWAGSPARQSVARLCEPSLRTARDSGPLSGWVPTQLQVKSLHWAIEEAARDGALLYLAYLDFENAFNSVDHEAIWRWLTELNIPDVDLLRNYTLARIMRQTCPMACRLRCISPWGPSKGTSCPHCSSTLSLSPS